MKQRGAFGSSDEEGRLSSKYPLISLSSRRNSDTCMSTSQKLKSFIDEVSCLPLNACDYHYRGEYGARDFRKILNSTFNMFKSSFGAHQISAIINMTSRTIHHPAWFCGNIQ